MSDQPPGTWQRILPWLKNKYVFTLLFLITWICFFDRNNFIIQSKYRSQLKALQTEKAYLLAEIEKNKADLNELMSSSDNLERYAREKYYMKKADEDIFVIVAEESGIK